MKGGFHSHEPRTGGLVGRRLRPLGPSGLAARWRNVPPEISEPTKEVAKLDLAVAIEEVREPLAQTPVRPKAEGPKVHIGFRLAADVVESLKASGPGYNARVEQALRQAGFGAAKRAIAKKAAAKRAPLAKRRA